MLLKGIAGVEMGLANAALRRMEALRKMEYPRAVAIAAF
jgi:hypothetical protein